SPGPPAATTSRQRWRRRIGTLALARADRALANRCTSRTARAIPRRLVLNGNKLAERRQEALENLWLAGGLRLKAHRILHRLRGARLRSPENMGSGARPGQANKRLAP